MNWDDFDPDAQEPLFYHDVGDPETDDWESHRLYKGTDGSFLRVSTGGQNSTYMLSTNKEVLTRAKARAWVQQHCPENLAAVG